MFKRLTIEEVEARQPDLVKGQEWRGVAGFYLYKCSNPKHEAYEQRYTVHAKGSGCEKCDVEKRIAYGTYYKNHNDKPE